MDAPIRPPLTAAEAVAAGIDFADLRVSALGLFWSQYDPLDGATRLWRHTDAGSQCLTPDGFSLRSRVYEYGGGAFCLTDDAALFVNEADQQLWHQPLDGAAPRLLHGRPEHRYGDLRFDAARRRLLAVEEAHVGGVVRHRLIAIGLEDSSRQVLREGADFYAAPTASPDGRSLAWIEWDRPHQPWTHTRLLHAALDTAGQPDSPRLVAGQEEESLQQPAFERAGRLICLTDRDGWWQPWMETPDGGFIPLPCADADHAGAPWQLGASSCVPLAEGGMFATWLNEGLGQLGILRNGQRISYAQQYSRFRALAARDGWLYCIAASPTQPSSILKIACDSGAIEVLAGGKAPLPPERIVSPQAIHYPSGDGVAHGFLYRPREADATPPLLVFVHGGPTSASYAAFDARIQYWVGLGYAVADLNYRGSTGYGRAYRQALHQRWGVADVEDACAVVAWLGEQGLADPQRAFIRGGSAGGYTTLCALAFQRVFRAGASLYGVSDPLALGKVTHKFEADYLDWLIGDPERDAERYRQRTPLLHAERIEVPVAFFQGMRDAVVVPEQTDSMVRALEARGIPCEVRRYPDEGHGFRQAANQADALECEAGFYRRWL